MAVPCRLPACLRALQALVVPGAPASDATRGSALAMSSDLPRTSPHAQATDRVDQDLVRRSLGGDQDAYAQIVQRYQQPIAAYLWRFTQDRAAWEELTHDVFVEAYFSLARYQARAPLQNWLKRIATRVGYRYWRQRRQRDLALETLAEPAAAGTESDLSSAETHELVQRLLACVSPRDRLVLTLAYLESQSTEEIAELTGWSRSMVKVQLHRARRRLARISQTLGITW